MRRALIAATTMLALSTTWLVATPAQSRVDGPSSTEVIETQSFDDGAYAATYQVSLGEAERRRGILNQVAAQNAEWQNDPSFGGVFVEHQPKLRVVASFTHAGARDVPEPLASTIEFRLVDRTIDELTDAADAAGDELEALNVDSSVNVADNSVELYTLSATVAPSTATESAVAADDDDLIVRVAERYGATIIASDVISRPSADIYGGLSLTTCTSGFSVISSSGSQGIVTAGHCQDAQSRSGLNLPFISQSYSGSSDVQYHAASSFTKRNWVADGIAGGTTPYYRTITAQVARASMYQGQPVCKQGRTTGYDCGTIDSIAYRPSYVPSGNATFVIASNASSVDMSEGGDSGGPWFYGNSAFGVMSGENGTSGIFMPIGYISSLNLSLKTS